MLRIFLAIIFILLSAGLTSQSQRRFDYSKTSFGSLYVKPLFDQSKPIGKEGLPTWTDQEYIDNFFYSPIDEVLSGKRDSLSPGSAFIIYFNTKGEVINCQFLIKSIDTLMVTEDDLYRIYQKFKHLKIDTNKVKIIPEYNTNWKEANYGMIAGQMVSKKGRSKIDLNKRK